MTLADGAAVQQRLEGGVAIGGAETLVVRVQQIASGGHQVGGQRHGAVLYPEVQHPERLVGPVLSGPRVARGRAQRQPIQ